MVDIPNGPRCTGNLTNIDQNVHWGTICSLFDMIDVTYGPRCTPNLSNIDQNGNRSDMVDKPNGPQTYQISFRTDNGERFDSYLIWWTHPMDPDVNQTYRISTRIGNGERFVRYLILFTYTMDPDVHQTSQISIRTGNGIRFDII